MSDRRRTRRILLEIAVDSASDAIAAADAGADRIELCSRLDLDGLTPPATMIESVKRATRVPVMVMIRPRAGDFTCDEPELAVMCRQIDESAKAGADGFVFGVIDAGGAIDEATTRRLVERSGGRQTVFHRAFDRGSSLCDSLDVLLRLGVTRVLTSGGASSAASESAIESLATLVKRAGKQIEILPGGGVRGVNARLIIEQTGCTQLHSSCREKGAASLSVELVQKLRAVCDAM
ncbi:MAG: copper homeostasis protein CutC [Pyrinomonadaceae bacterium]|nr:copper homeostasis protein CutC [Phycisphaerales bacterium]